MSNIRAIQNVHADSIEFKLLRMKALDDQIKELQAEKDMLKEQVIAEHFNDNEEYRTPKGLLLASYKALEVVQFQQSAFKSAHEEMYMQYCEKKIQFRFLLK